jgi:hypothetical protein
MSEIGTVIFNEEAGFSGVCNAPCFTISGGYEVWAPDDPNNPIPNPENNTYIYTLTHEGGAGPFVLETYNFLLSVNTDLITSIGVLDSNGIEPSAFSIQGYNDTVTWSFGTNLLGPGETTQKLFIHSPLNPGFIDASISGQAATTAINRTIGPLTNEPWIQAPEPSTSLLIFTGLLLAGLFSKVKGIFK